MVGAKAVQQANGVSLERVRGAAAASGADSPEQGGSSCKPSNRAGGLAYLEAQRKIGKHGR